MPITNCHIHTFLVDHVPENFLPLKLVRILKNNTARKPLGWLLRNIFPFTDRDLLDRYINLVEVTVKEGQEFIFQKVRGFYMPDTKFVILPMDMEYMAAGNVKKGLVQQLDEILEMYVKFPDLIIPFVAVDPRRINVMDVLKKYIEEHNFKGIKIYPRLGFYPTDDDLKPIFKYAEENNLPVLSHCSRGGVYTRKVTDKMLKHPRYGEVKKVRSKRFSHYFTEPMNYEIVLKEFPKLKICLAHFGGNVEWDKYLDEPWDPDNPDLSKKSWLADILDLMKKYKNLYTDISYTAFHSERYFPLLNVLLEDPNLRDRIMFGSDYYMLEREKKTEREMSILLRYALREEKFLKISGENINDFLYKQL